MKVKQNTERNGEKRRRAGERQKERGGLGELVSDFETWATHPRWIENTE